MYVEGRRNALRVELLINKKNKKGLSKESTKILAHVEDKERELQSGFH